MVGPQVLEITLRPRSEADRERLDRALAQLTAADPSFATCTGPSGQVILKGMGELHLDSKIDALKRIHKVDAAIGAPQVAYRETITRRVTVDYTHKKQTGGSGQFGRVKIVVEPNEPGAGYVFASKIVGGAVPDEYIPAVEHGLMRALGSGVIAGFSVVDLRVQLVDGAYHKVDSSVPAFEIAAEAALREAMQKGEPVLLEPIMKAEVTTPPEYAGAIIRDLKTRRATILDGFDVVTAFVPLANLFGYVNTLRSLSRGRATFTMRYDHYAPLPTTDNDPPFCPAAAMRLT